MAPTILIAIILGYAGYRYSIGVRAVRATREGDFDRAGTVKAHAHAAKWGFAVVMILLTVTLAALGW